MYHGSFDLGPSQSREPLLDGGFKGSHEQTNQSWEVPILRHTHITRNKDIFICEPSSGRRVPSQNGELLCERGHRFEFLSRKKDKTETGLVFEGNPPKQRCPFDRFVWLKIFWYMCQGMLGLENFLPTNGFSLLNR